MSVSRFLAWWPAVGLAAMVLLGWVVGKGSTPLDDAFHAIDVPGWRLMVAGATRLLAVVWLAAIAAALWGSRWSLAVAAAVTPPVAVACSRVFKALFERDLDGALAYPSGHATALVAVLGVAVLVCGGRVWALAVATVCTLGGMFVIGSTFHYFTDTVGALLLATSMVCLAARLTAWQPTAARPDPALQPVEQT